MKNIKLVATDLDGTFLKNDRTVSPANIDALHKLGEKQIVRVAATGRNLQKVKDVLQPDLPFRLCGVFVGGRCLQLAKKGTYCQPEYKSFVGKKTAFDHFIHRDVNFHAFYPVPDNHKHYYYRGKDDCEEFERYFNFNVAHAEPLKTDDLPKGELCQFLIIIKQNEERFNQLKKDIEALCPEIRVIRASSPITPGYIWIEVFHHSVSKGNGVNEICKRLGISKDETMGLGNDYNDFDLLEFTMHSFLTDNSPHEIKDKYPVVPLAMKIRCERFA